MKKKMMSFAASRWLLAIAFYCVMGTESMLAQTSVDMNEYCTLTNQIKTTREYSIDNPDRPYDQDSLRAGIQFVFYYLDIKTS